jgi:hypothetical protein
VTSPQRQLSAAPPPAQPPPSGGGAAHLSAGQMAALLALVQAQALVRERLTRTAVLAVVAQVHGFSNWWDGRAVDQMVGRILRIVQATQRQVAQVTDGFQARALTIITGRTVRPVGAVDITRLRTQLPAETLRELAAGRQPPVIELGDTVDGAGQRINEPLPPLAPAHQVKALDPATPYGRIAEQYRFHVVAHGESPDAAQAKAQARAGQVVDTDVTLANRAQARAVYGKYERELRITGYRRILHPERGGGGPPCGLCVVAADRTYHVENLKEIHDRCRCEVMPIVAGQVDPGLTLNSDDLAAIYTQAGGTGAAQLKRIRVGVAQHGELGPVLVDMSQRFRGPAEVAKATGPDKATRLAAQLEALEKSLGRLRVREAAGETGLSQAVDWQTNRIDQLRRELATA